MAKKVEYCVNHPGVAATGTCIQCGKPICYNCMVEEAEYVFCSTHCATRYLIKDQWKRLVRGLKKVLLTPLYPFKWLGRLSLRGWLTLFLSIGILTSFYFIWKLIRDVRSLKKQLHESTESVDMLEPIEVGPPRIFQPAEGGMVFSNVIDIHGESKNNRIITLSLNGILKQVLLPEAGQFTFKNVRLNRGINKLEVRAITQEGAVSTLQMLTITYANPTLPYLSRDFRRGPLNRKEVAFTFDAGSINNVSDEILDFLKDKGVKGTFFLTGQFIKNYPETVKRIAREGHQVGNHTWSHPHLTTYDENREHKTLPEINQKRIQEEFQKTASLYTLVTKKEMAPLWRAPFGEYNSEILTWAAMEGYRHVGWTRGSGWRENMDTMDWIADKNSTGYRTADEIAEKILAYGKAGKRGANGIIILMHMGTNRKDDFPHKKLPDIIDGLRQQGYRFVTISDMMGAGQ
jgi:peptidoglycan/xylan/chitin deacetylase (PgdA/CDA1 family)